RVAHRFAPCGYPTGARRYNPRNREVRRFLSLLNNSPAHLASVSLSLQLDTFRCWEFAAPVGQPDPDLLQTVLVPGRKRPTGTAPAPRSGRPATFVCARPGLHL